MGTPNTFIIVLERAEPLILRVIALREGEGSHPTNHYPSRLNNLALRVSNHTVGEGL